MAIEQQAVHYTSIAAADTNASSTPTDDPPQPHSHPKQLNDDHTAVDADVSDDGDDGVGTAMPSVDEAERSSPDVGGSFRVATALLLIVALLLVAFIAGSSMRSPLPSLRADSHSTATAAERVQWTDSAEAEATEVEAAEMEAAFALTGEAGAASLLFSATRLRLRRALEGMALALLTFRPALQKEMWLGDCQSYLPCPSPNAATRLAKPERVEDDDVYAQLTQADGLITRWLHSQTTPSPSPSLLFPTPPPPSPHPLSPPPHPPPPSWARRPPLSPSPSASTPTSTRASTRPTAPPPPSSSSTASTAAAASAPGHTRAPSASPSPFAAAAPSSKPRAWAATATPTATAPD